MRPVRTAADIKAVQELASRLWPLTWHPGGLGWALARDRLAEEVALVDGPNGIAGWAARGVDEPDYLLALADPRSPTAADAIAKWFVETATRPELTIEIVDEDPVLLDALSRAGFTVQAAGSVSGMRRAV